MARHEERKKFSCSNLPERCFAFFDEMRSERQLCDITFNVGEVSISAHRIILAAAIPYFRNMFSQGIDEVPDIQPSTLACLIDYAYTCEVNIDTDNVESLLAAACHLGIDEVKEACFDFLSDGLEPETAWSVRELAIRFKCSTLLEEADWYICENFNVISRTRDFLNYPLMYLKELINKNDLNIEKEKEALDAVLCWVKEAPEDRKNGLPELLCAIRMPLMELGCLTNAVKSEELIRTSLSCRDLIDEAKDYNLLPEMRKAVCSFKTQPRRNRKEEYARQDQIENPCIYKLNARRVYTVQHFNLLQKKWNTENPKTFDIFCGSAVHLQNKVYFFHLNTTLQYDPKGRSFKSMSSMSNSRELVGATALKNNIYVCGGILSNGKVSDVVECFDPAAKQWTTVKSLPTSRFGLSAVTLGEYIFTLGGKDSGVILNTVERYDPKHGKWTTMSSMLVNRCRAGAATLNGRIYVCGGISSTGVVATGEVYDLIGNHWVLISPLSSARYFFALLSSQRKLHAIGGENDKLEQVHTFDVYDPEKDKWTCGSSTDRGFYASCAVVMADVDA